MAKRQLPPFNLARGAANLTSAPPFTFHGVTCRMFPLKANMLQLRSFCNDYLNVMPPTIAWYEPSLPYVFLIILNYGKMGPGNFGWVSQNEVAFGVALDWYKEENGKLVFQDWGFVCPFIFVDEESSLTTGREVYGWPKVKAQFETGVSPWARHPRNPRRLLTVKTDVVPKVVTGTAQKPRTLLEIYQDPPPTLSLFPPTFSNPLNPWIALPTLVQGAASLAGGISETIVRPRLAGYDTPQYGADDLAIRIGRLFEQLRKAAASAWLGGDTKGLVTVNCLNLKQFRSATHPENACYQAVTNSKMEVLRFHRGGLLGDVELAQGDLSGGYFIDIHNYDEQPIIDALGIEVATHEEQAGPVDTLSRVTAGPIGNTRFEEREVLKLVGSEPAMARTVVNRLRPTLPLWMEVDLRYTRGSTVASRTARSAWRAGSEVDSNAEAPPPKPLPFNIARRAATQAARGPFEFRDVSRRVFPLLARRETLQKFVDGYLNFMDEDESHRYPAGYFEVWGRYVYMVATNYGAMSSPSNDAGWFAKRDVAFVVPLKWYDKRGGDLLTVTSVVPFAYADSGRATTTGREVQGIPVAKALLESPPDSWMSEGGIRTNAERQLLACRMNLIPSLGSGLMAEERTLFEVVMGEAVHYGDQDGLREIAKGWGEELAEDYLTKVVRGYSHIRAEDVEGDTPRPGPGQHLQVRPIADGERCVTFERRPAFQHLRSLALDPLARQVPTSSVTLKQFRDAEEPDDACYQALLYCPTTCRSVAEIEEIEERIHILIHAYPTQPIVEKLGLVVKTADSEKPAFPGRAAEGAEIQCLEPIRPFWTRTTTSVELSEVLCWRSGSPTWQDRKVEDPKWREGRYLCGGAPRPLLHDRALDFIQEDLRRVMRPDHRLEGRPETWKDLQVHVGNWARAADGSGEETEDRAWHDLTVRTIQDDEVEPQMVFESILGEGWESAREERQPSDFLFSGNSVGVKSREFLFGATLPGPPLPDGTLPHLEPKRSPDERPHDEHCLDEYSPEKKRYRWEVEDNWAFYVEDDDPARHPGPGGRRPGGRRPGGRRPGGHQDADAMVAQERQTRDYLAGKELEDTAIAYSVKGPQGPPPDTADKPKKDDA